MGGVNAYQPRHAKPADPRNLPTRGLQGVADLLQVIDSTNSSK